MDLVKGVLVVLHIIGFGVLFGSALAQIPAVRAGRARVTEGILHGAALLFATGLLIVAVMVGTGSEINNFKVSVKTVVLIAIVIVILANRKKPSVSGGVLGAIAGLATLNLALAVLWA